MKTPSSPTLVSLSLFDVPVPAAGIDAFLDNDDAFWWAFDRYGASRGYHTFQIFSLRQGTLDRAVESRTKGATEYIFVSRPTVRMLCRLPRLLHGSHLVLFHNESLSSLLLGIGARLRGKRVAAFYHNELNTRMSVWQRMLLGVFRRRVLDAAWTTTPTLKQKLTPVLGCPVILFPFGVDTDVLHPMPRTQQSMFRVLYCGRISPEKRIEDVVEGIAHSPFKTRILLTLAGEDYSPDHAYLRKLIASCEQAAVTCRHIGHVPHSQLQAVYAEADVLVNMRPDEGFGKVFVEAMATGLPVIGRRGAPGVIHLIHDGENGFIADTPQDLAAALGRLLQSPELGKQMGERGRVLIEKEYSRAASLTALTASLDALLTYREGVLSCPV
jgi:glycosyltransferase involved in cell wall biosynthesis